MTSHPETLTQWEILEVAKAYWSHNFLDELGPESAVLLLYLMGRQSVKPVSVNVLAQKLKTRWRTAKDVIDALEDAGFLRVRKTPKGLLIFLELPEWKEEVPEDRP